MKNALVLFGLLIIGLGSTNANARPACKDYTTRNACNNTLDKDQSCHWGCSVEVDDHGNSTNNCQCYDGKLVINSDGSGGIIQSTTIPPPPVTTNNNNITK